MKRLVTMLLVLFMGLLAPIGVMGDVYADSLVSYSACLVGSNGVPATSMRVDIDSSYSLQTDNAGCFTTMLSPISHSIRFVGAESFSNSLSSYLDYTIGYTTGVLSGDTTLRIIIPLAQVNISTSAVDGQVVSGAMVTFPGTATGPSVTIPGYGENGLFVVARTVNNNTPTTNSNGQFQIMYPQGIAGTLQIDADPSYGLIEYNKPFGPFIGDSNYQAVMQYPAPNPPQNPSATFDDQGYVHLHWTPSPGAITTHIYKTSSTSPLATVLGTQTDYVDGPYTTPGEYDYLLASTNQYGYESAYTEFAGYLDHTAPVLDSFSVSPTPRTIGQTSTITAGYHDNETYVQRVEYFINDDPGQGNATQFTATDQSGNYIGTLDTSFPVGVYAIGVRAEDAAGNWTPVTYDYLVVYDPTSNVGVTGKSKKDFVPTLANGDVLPGLISSGQTEAVDYGFTVDFKKGALDPSNDFQFSYATGSQCGKPNATNCHSLTVNASEVNWLLIDQANNSRARFSGMAVVSVDGSVTTNPFSVEVVDGDRLVPATRDHVIFKVFAVGANPATATPLYQASGDLSKSAGVVIR